MTRPIVIACFLTLATMISCIDAFVESEKIDITNPNPPEKKGEFVSFNATLESPYTRAALDMSSTLKVSWEKGDRVRITDGQKTAVYQATSGGSSETVLEWFSGDTLSIKTGTMYKAFYPVDAGGHGVASDIKYHSKEKLKGVPMVAEGMKVLEFRNVAGVFSCEYVPVKNVVATSVYFSAKEYTAGDSHITMDCTSQSLSGLRLSNTSVNVFNVPVLPGVYNEFTVTFYNGNDKVDQVVFEYPLEAQRSKLTVVDLNNPYGKTGNLSRGETANCYMIWQAGDYKFTPAKGNSKEELDGIVRVGVLWEMNNMSIAPETSIFKSLELSEGMVYFSTQDDYVPGNAIIAAYDEEDNILWSWHIWAMKTAVANLEYDSEGKYIMMDRSLGALDASRADSAPSNDYASSLLYQWGRKDPFPGQVTQKENNKRPLIVVKGDGKKLDDGPVSVEVSIANPTSYYKSEGNWTDESTAWDTEKTIYDPCPPGYRVPDVEVFSGDIFQKVTDGKSKDGAYLFTYEGTRYWFPLSAYFTCTTGTRDSESYSSLFVTWSISSDGDNSVAPVISYDSGKKKPALDKARMWPKATGASVRCQKIL